MSINTSKRTLAFTVVVTLGFSLFYWGISQRFNNILNGYGILLLLLSLAFFFLKAKIESKIENKLVRSVLTMLMAVVLGLSINSVISKYADGLWWAYIIIGAALYAYADEVTTWLT